MVKPDGIQRISKIDTYLNVAEAFAYRSTCIKRKHRLEHVLSVRIKLYSQPDTTVPPGGMTIAATLVPAQGFSLACTRGRATVCAGPSMRNRMRC